ncbi:MAG: SagB/ThcOx family dehydrogenase, partial [Candidatus Electrothrix sp. AUS3]|nr:SagB/ThcOx family dehydrogenase [Candidatus Electrothrix gigas]
HHYNKRSNRLESFPVRDKLFPADKIRQNMSGDLAAVLFISGVFTRIRLQYGERGYRYMLFEAGRVIEQMQIKADALQIPLQLMPDFFDDAANAFLGLDGVEESVLFLAAIVNLFS